MTERLTAGRLLDYCLAKPGAWQDEPWEDDATIVVVKRTLRA